MDKRFIGALVAIIVIFAGVYYITSHKNAGNSGPKGQLSNHVYGSNKAGVTFTEYGDYQCPTCGSYYPVVKQVVEKYKDDIQFQFRNFPLTSIHQNAFAAARAAEAADAQNKYWDMHDKLYENQQAWETSSQPLNIFTQYAQQIGLDATKFKQDYGSEKVNAVINADLSEANHLKLNGTPSFFLDGKPLELNQLIGANSAPSAEKIEQAIQKAIDSKQKASTTKNTDTTQPAPATNQ